MPEELLSEAGLRAISLEDLDELRLTAREVLEREIARRKYDLERDVRQAPVWPADRPSVFVSGDSGQGKTWQVARLAEVRAKGGRIVVLADARGEAERDLQRASDLLWKEAWGHDRPISLDRLIERWRRVRGESGNAWLTVCVENVQSLSEARALLRDYDWERWGVELAITGPPQIGAVLAQDNPEKVHHVRLRDFTPAELREYLRRYARSWETVPADVRDTLKRPLLAGLYASLGSDPHWEPKLEYDLYERYWQKIERELIEHPKDLYLVKRLALKLSETEPSYPWTWDQLREVGVDSDTQVRLERAGWWTRNDEGVEVWHDRLLSWSLAEAIAQRGSGEVVSLLMSCFRSRRTRIGRILGYVPMDVLWLLCGDLGQRDLVPDVIERLEGRDAFGPDGLYRRLLPTIGLRVVPGLIQRLRRFPDQVRYSYIDLAVKALSKILDREKEGRAKLPPLLHDSSAAIRRIGVLVLARHPHLDAIEILWDLHSRNSLAQQETRSTQTIVARQESFAALRACLELDPEWLRRKIRQARPEEPSWELAYLLANIKHPVARSIWRDVKGELFEKVPPHKLRSLGVCIRVFQDREEIPRLERWLSIEDDWTNSYAFRALAWVDPDRAVALAKTLSLRILSVHPFGSWLPVLHLRRPEETRQNLRARMAGSHFWEVADLYSGYEEMMDSATTEVLLDRLALELADTSQDPEEVWRSLRRPLRRLSRIHRLDLLQLFQARAGTELDRGLGQLGATRIDSKKGYDIEELRAVLLKIGGEGIRRLIQAGLASADPDLHEEALAWALTCPEEFAASAPREEWVLAALGEDRPLIEAILAWEGEIENEDLVMLWRLRRWKPPMSDADLASALDALGSKDPKRWVKGLAALSISGRNDLLSCLSEWLKKMEGSVPEDLQTLDARIAHLVHRHGKSNPEAVWRLTQSLDVRRFPYTAIQLLYEGGPVEFADQLEADLLEQLAARGRLTVAEMDIALHLSQARELPNSLLQAVWESGKSFPPIWSHERFFPAVSRIDSEEVRERIFQEAFEGRHTDQRTYAIRALHALEPDEALRAARMGLEEESDSTERVPYVLLLREMMGPEAVSLLIDQAVRERKTEVLWAIARTLRRAGLEAEQELKARLESEDFRSRRRAVFLAGWQGPSFLATDLQRMARHDPDDNVQVECLQALDRQHKERCVRELMDAFEYAQGIARWSYLESILELGDPRLLVTEDDPLWLGRILRPSLGVLEVHANWRLKDRFRALKASADQRDRNNGD